MLKAHGSYGTGSEKGDEIVISTDNTEDLEILKKFFEENL